MSDAFSRKNLDRLSQRLAAMGALSENPHGAQLLKGVAGVLEALAVLVPKQAARVSQLEAENVELKGAAEPQPDRVRIKNPPPYSTKHLVWSKVKGSPIAWQVAFNGQKLDLYYAPSPFHRPEELGDAWLWVRKDLQAENARLWDAAPLHVVFEGCPTDGGRFVDVVAQDGRILDVGPGKLRDDGYWEFILPRYDVAELERRQALWTQLSLAITRRSTEAIREQYKGNTPEWICGEVDGLTAIFAELERLRAESATSDAKLTCLRAQLAAAAADQAKAIESAYAEGWDDSGAGSSFLECWAASEAKGALGSVAIGVEGPPASEFLRTLAHELRTQDNAITAHPYFLVQQEVRDYGYDTCWSDEGIAYLHCDGFELDGEELKVAEELWATSHRTKDEITRTAYRDRWEFVQAFLTRKAAEDFIQRQAHNYPKGLRVYVESAHRNPEIQALRKAILDIAQEVNQ